MQVFNLETFTVAKAWLGYFSFDCVWLVLFGVFVGKKQIFVSKLIACWTSEVPLTLCTVFGMLYKD